MVTFAMQKKLKNITMIYTKMLMSELPSFYFHNNRAHVFLQALLHLSTALWLWLQHSLPILGLVINQADLPRSVSFIHNTYSFMNMNMCFPDCLVSVECASNHDIHQLWLWDMRLFFRKRHANGIKWWFVLCIITHLFSLWSILISF